LFVPRRPRVIHKKTINALDRAHRGFVREHRCMPATAYIYMDTDEKTVLHIEFVGELR
jgi:hypothetical protein